MTTEIKFLKMHGLGNDFVVIDNRNKPIVFSNEQIKLIANRNFGIGCDQLVLIENSRAADCFMRIYNSDGSEVDSCGNASRCIAYLIAKEKAENHVRIQTNAGILTCKIDGKKIAVDMGKPEFNWQKIPLARDIKSIDLCGLTGGFPVSMGNPHVVFFVDDIEKYNLAEVGRKIEVDKLFPARTNVEIVQVISQNYIKLAVWERGAGATLACGTGACATLVAAASTKLTGRQATIELPGGKLDILWDSNDNLIMTGEVEIVFSGKFELT